MDDKGTRAYVDDAMNLLLLLSALLSALTGVGAQARAPQVAQAIADTSSVAPVRVARISTVSSRQTQAVPALIAVAVSASSPSTLPAAEPLWANRRRE